jgi:biopolymer transport protein ExbD
MLLPFSKIMLLQNRGLLSEYSLCCTVSVSEVQDYIYQERENMKEEDQPFMTVSLKVDKDTKMGIVQDVKQALRQAYALKINYSATQRQ